MYKYGLKHNEMKTYGVGLGEGETPPMDMENPAADGDVGIADLKQTSDKP
jgi:hypothetical protein